MILLAFLLAAVTLQKPAYTNFYRNQTDAAVRIGVTSETTQSAIWSGEVAGDACTSRTVRVNKGTTFLTLPFDAGSLPAGTYPWSAALTETNGAPLASIRGTLRIFPRLDRHAFKMMSWGGWKSLSVDYMKKHALNSVNVKFTDPHFADYLDASFFLNLRIENSRTPEVTETFDLAKAADAARENFLPYQGLHTWQTTLVNTEVYGGRWLGIATNMPAWCGLARRELGFEPCFLYTNPPVELNYAALGVAPFSGVLPACPALDALLWFQDSGLPVYRVNAALREMIHTLSPDNIVWTEPPYASCGLFRFVDASASWVYDYPVGTCLSNFRRMFAAVRPFSKKCYPTLGDGYWHRRTPHGRHPTAKNPNHPEKPLSVRCGQTADELMIKSYLALGSAPCEGLSFFACDVWAVGEENAAKFAANPETPVKFIAEPGSTERYGTFVRETFQPVAELLRNMTNAPAKVALVRLQEVATAGGFGWQNTHYASALAEYLGDAPVASDFIYDNEFTVDALSRYRYVILPMHKVVTAAHDAIIRKAAENGVTFVIDTYCPIDYPGAIRLPIAFKMLSNDAPDTSAHRKAFLDWYETTYADLRQTAGAASDEDGPDVFTLEKNHLGARYVTIVNNTRDTAAKTVMNAFCTNDWYHPVGAPRTITTRIRASQGSAIYDFTAGGKLVATVGATGEAVLTKDFRAAEGRVLSIYPTLLKELRLKTLGTFAPRGTAFLGVGVADANGYAAPGRQLIELTLTDSAGVQHDASGRYVAERGRVKIPIRFARNAATGVWHARLKELTTGLTNETTITVAGTSEKVPEYSPYFLEVKGNRNPAVYRSGETAAMTVRLLKDGVPVKGAYMLGSFNYANTNRYDITEKGAHVTFSLDHPGQIIFRGDVYDADGHRIRGRTAENDQIHPLIAWSGALFDSTKIKTSRTKPADFDAYWSDEVARQKRKVPLTKAKVTKRAVPCARDGFREFDVIIPSLSKRPACATLILPDNAAEKSLPLIALFQGAGSSAAKKDYYSRAILLSVNAHGIGNCESKATWRDYFAGTGKDYMYQNWLNRDTCFFHDQILRDLRALEWAKTLPEWNGKDLLVIGVSMGGSQALQMAALDRDVTFAYARDPALCDHSGLVADPPHRPGWPWILARPRHLPALTDCGPVDPKLLAASDYFDNIFFASRITAPTYVSTGLADDTCAAEGILMAFHAIRGKKKLETHPRHIHCGSRNAAAEEVLNALR